MPSFEDQKQRVDPDVYRTLDAGRALTSAGVASGLDMALHLITRLTADDVGENVARSLEHVWQRDPGQDPFAS